MLGLCTEVADYLSSKSLKKKIRLQLLSIKTLKEELRTIRNARYSESTISVVSSDQEAQETVVDLAREILGNANVPESTTPSSSMDENNSQRSRSVSHIEVSVNTDVEVGPEQSSTLGPRPIVPTVEPHRLFREQPSPILTHQTTEIAGSSNTNPNNPILGDDYLCVREITQMLDLDFDDSYKSRGGYINTDKGRVYAIATIAPNFGENVIDVGYARRLGLQVHPLDEDDQWIGIENGQQIRRVGKVSLKWSTMVAQFQLYFRVHCWALEHTIENLVFGLPYHQKEKHYLRHQQLQRDESAVASSPQWEEVTPSGSDGPDSGTRERRTRDRRPSRGAEISSGSSGVSRTSNFGQI